MNLTSWLLPKFSNLAAYNGRPALTTDKYDVTSEGETLEREQTSSTTASVRSTNESQYFSAITRSLELQPFVERNLQPSNNRGELKLNCDL